ncbi:putative SHQ1 protein [Lyophyllum shimeji]|uniref:SHQ1 protein n=1 Tax=Lyophyllum shimeji TaxID=47721 RepID=A0A9P3UJD8_LYOSH|nr:putative SHQ1 protein [Lyophyllum shimeji]
MITPRFSCSQTEESVIISIYCPSVRAADVEIHVEETLVSVHINPYFLRLNFSYPLVEDESSLANYDPSSGYLTLTLTKENKGQVFDDLDLLAKLLAPRPAVPHPTIEVVSEGTEQTDQTEQDDLAMRTRSLSLHRKEIDLSLEREEILRAAENDWQLPQEVPEPPLSTSVQKYYGFLNMHSGYFRHVTHTENEVNELGADAEVCTVAERRRKRLQHEEQKWDEEYYMADFADDEYIRELLTWTHPHTDHIENFQYTEEENAVMLRLPRKEYLATPTQTHNLYLTLLTLLFAYAYESRTTQHDPTPESAWTISTLTPAFSALDPPNSAAVSVADPLTFSTDELSETFVTSYRRSLAFPLYRSFILAEACRMDVAGFLSRGKRTVVRCLLEMKNILDHHEVYYVYSKVWVDDFCVWTQAYASDDMLLGLGKQVAELRIAKSSIGWRLEALEAATQEIEERESDSDDEDSDDSA